ncbi:Imidazole glycerol phosphate synthase subunit HisH 1 [Lacunisphaera limnophila]|uniref:Imidazole glycerol phosphate synthase subunit HisH n=1 Tax=Lacunisphaera limnophila TaxID=1838286 RepID=A0A1D8AVR5_9BACT|nr:imidazole glycerol phosphate synthase subunit HisH [Lacunisphaera limnophila]AOS44987.1 Imidazole glycerol phosphate synthase subunit HisH 1 [Lacunisphaera limnophila]
MKSPEVTIIDYGVGNLLSVQRGFEHCGATTRITAEASLILAADRVVLPGVGAFGDAMMALEQRGLVAVVKEVVARGIPLLGICLGMQMLLDESEEFGLSTGLGVIPGRVVPVPDRTVAGAAQKIPHIGWNSLVTAPGGGGWGGTVLQDIRAGEATYFVHSFMAVPRDPAHRLADCLYGGHALPAVIRRDRITGCQFHPEKSGPVGLRILRNFIAQ